MGMTIRSGSLFFWDPPEGDLVVVMALEVPDEEGVKPLGDVEGRRGVTSTGKSYFQMDLPDDNEFTHGDRVRYQLLADGHIWKSGLFERIVPSDGALCAATISAILISGGTAGVTIGLTSSDPDSNIWSLVVGAVSIALGAISSMFTCKPICRPWRHTLTEDEIEVPRSPTFHGTPLGSPKHVMPPGCDAQGHEVPAGRGAHGETPTSGLEPDEARLASPAAVDCLRGSRPRLDSPCSLGEEAGAGDCGPPRVGRPASHVEDYPPLLQPLL
jgi:hypothetical protein